MVIGCLNTTIRIWVHIPLPSSRGSPVTAPCPKITTPRKESPDQSADVRKCKHGIQR